MKKRYLIYMMTILIFTFIISSCTNEKNTDWKDTHRTYGTGVYSSFTHKVNGENVYGLSNNIYHEVIIDQIVCEKEVNNKLYIFGNHLSFTAYIVIDLKNGKAIYYPTNSKDESLLIFSINQMIEDGNFKLLSSYDEFSEEEKGIFNGMINK